MAALMTALMKDCHRCPAPADPRTLCDNRRHQCKTCFGLNIIHGMHGRLIRCPANHDD